jgi:hypothetical protein
MSGNRQRGSVWQRLVRLLGFGPRESVAPSGKPSSPSSASSTSSGTKKQNADGWSFSIRVDGDDLVCDDTTCTWFGGCDDPLDNGQTASGVPTCGNPMLLGCALPVVGHHPSTKGSPLAFSPRIPWHTQVEVTYKKTGKTITVPLLDNGPAKWAKDGIDLTQAAFKLFAPLKTGVIQVSFRVKGAAKYKLNSK